MNKLFYKLSEKEKKEFSDCFYEKIGKYLPEGMTLKDVLETGAFFSDPWTWGKEIKPLSGESIQEKVDSYIELYLDDIINEIKKTRAYNELHRGYWQDDQDGLIDGLF